MSLQSKKKQLEKYKIILAKPKNSRSDLEIRELLEFFLKVPTVASLTEENILQLCQCSTLQYVKDREEVYSQDSNSDAFFVVLIGIVHVTKRLVAGFSTLLPGDGFGHIEILKKTPRVSTCTAIGNTYLIRVDIEDYTRLFEAQHQKELEQRVMFLTEVSVLRHMTESEMHLMAEMMTEQTFPPNKVIIKEGEDGNNMYFIVNGKANVVMTIMYKGQPRFIEITHLGTNDFFGELSLINASPRNASVIAHTSLTLLVLSSSGFSSVITGSTLQSMKEYVKRYTPRSEIVRLFSEQQQWSEYKKKLVDSIIQNKQKRRGV